MKNAASLVVKKFIKCLRAAAGSPAGILVRARCAEARTTNGWETRKIREERSAGLARIAALEALGRSIGMFTGPRLLGRPPKQR